jgi:hypothetical protein
MAGKGKNKGKSQRRQEKERRRQQKRAKRMSGPRSARPPLPSGAGAPENEMLADLLPLFLGEDEEMDGPVAGPEQLGVSLWKTDVLAEEPELEDMLLDPLKTVEVLIQAAEAQGIDPEVFGDSEDQTEEQADAVLNVLGQVAAKLLGDEERNELRERLARLRTRCTEAGERHKALLASLTYVALDQEVDANAYSIIGLVQAILRRSLAAGFEMLRPMERLIQEADEADASVPLADRIKQAIDEDETAQIFEQVPGLSDLMRRQLDRAIERGQMAVFHGEVVLGLYSAEEIAAALESMRELMPRQPDAEAADPDTPEPPPTDAEKEAVLDAMKRHVTALMTPERRAQAAAHLKRLLEDPPFDREYVPYAVHVLGLLESDELDDYDRALLTTVLLGEMQVHFARPGDED